MIGSVLLVCLAVNPGRLNTSIYTFHRIGSYSVSDLYLDFEASRYSIRSAIEKRPNDFGLKSATIEIDSIGRYYTLVLGEKKEVVNAPFSSTLDIWGIGFGSRQAAVFAGRTRDLTASLPPTFNRNNYTVGCRLQRNLAYRAPVDFFLVRKSDTSGTVYDNTTAGAASKIRLAADLATEHSLAMSQSNLGPGAAFSSAVRYSGAKYGGISVLKGSTAAYATPANTMTGSSLLFQTSAYAVPAGFLRINQELAIEGLSGFSAAATAGLTRPPLPDFSYSAGYANRSGTFGQSVRSSWRCRRFFAAGHFGWDAHRSEFGLAAEQGILGFRIWSQLAVSDSRLYRVGVVLPVNRSLSLKGYADRAVMPGSDRDTRGAEVQASLSNNLNLHATYENVSSGAAAEHYFSLNFSNTVLFDRTGFGFIGGRVFIDQNANQIFDAADSAVPEIEIVLDDKTVATTDRNGNYLFSFIQSGRHDVSVNLKCLPAGIGSERRRDTVSTRFMTRSRIHFPLGQLGLIEGRVYYDRDRNNEYDGKKDGGVPNIVLALNGYMTTTDEKGYYRFANLPAGAYVLEVKTLPPAAFLLVPDMLLSCINITPGQSFKNYNIALSEEERTVTKKIFTEQKLAVDKKPAPASRPEPAKKVDRAKVDELFKKGVLYFTGERFDQALRYFNQVLDLDPGHKKARDYKKRTEARLKAVKGG